MPHVTVGYQDGTIHPLWLVKAGMRMARLFGAESLWVQDHYMGFIPAHCWTPEVTPAAKAIHSPDACFDALQILAMTATKIRGADIGTLVTEPFEVCCVWLRMHWVSTPKPQMESPWPPLGGLAAIGRSSP